MIVLAIDTAGADCAAALYDSDSDAVLCEVTETIGRGHAEKLMAIIEQVFKGAGLEMSVVERIAVTIGPGSFTGIRVGVAAARGLALALDVEAVGVSTLQVLAAEMTRKTEARKAVLSAIDAKRGEVYVQRFASDATAVSEPTVMPIEEAKALSSDPDVTIVGSAAALLGGADAADAVDHFPIAVVARLGTTAVSGKPSPLYLRGPDAKPQMGFAVARM